LAAGGRRWHWTTRILTFERGSRKTAFPANKRHDQPTTSCEKYTFTFRTVRTFDALAAWRYGKVCRAWWPQLVSRVCGEAGRGLVATSQVQKGEALLRVPRGLLIDADLATAGETLPISLTSLAL
jgi:hypothetical protein